MIAFTIHSSSLCFSFKENLFFSNYMSSWKTFLQGFLHEIYINSELFISVHVSGIKIIKLPFVGNISCLTD